MRCPTLKEIGGSDAPVFGNGGEATGINGEIQSPDAAGPPAPTPRPGSGMKSARPRTGKGQSVRCLSLSLFLHIYNMLPSFPRPPEIRSPTIRPPRRPEIEGEDGGPGRGGDASEVSSLSSNRPSPNLIDFEGMKNNFPLFDIIDPTSRKLLYGGIVKAHADYIVR